MMKAMEEEEARTSAAAGSSKKASKKRRASTSTEREARRDKRKKKDASTSGARPEETIERGRASPPPMQMTEECPKPPPAITIAEASSPVRKGPGRVPPLDYAEDSLVASPSGVVATRYIYTMDPDRDLSLLKGATDSEAAMAWGGEVVKRLTRAHQTVKDTSRSFDEAMGQHAEVLAHLEELEALRAREQRAAEAREETLKAELMAEKETRAAEKKAMGSELVEVKAHVAEEARRLKDEAIHTWDLSKDDFLKSAEFDALCAKKSWGYFKHASGCLAQFRASGYPEEEHPTSFLNVKQALADMDDQEEAEEGGEEEEEEEEVCFPSSGESYSFGCGCLLRRCRCVTGLKCRAGRLRCLRRRATRVASVELGFVAELVGLRCLRRRATRVASAELGFSARVGLPPEEVLVRNWA
ncbi:hypothetical protein F511_39403 [Dorcoceras hygrometricum]|uniref:Uncharacterized protein n=1 Tax=Dorcoceras hygrometricum TaxID=472368 RepID=A0A2Z7C6I3_9LAMI|nr:hypothetical protein F511_39403 [Dorcoceras hygrometricum]